MPRGQVRGRDEIGDRPSSGLRPPSPRWGEGSICFFQFSNLLPISGYTRQHQGALQKLENAQANPDFSQRWQEMGTDTLPPRGNDWNERNLRQ